MLTQAPVFVLKTPLLILLSCQSVIYKKGFYPTRYFEVAIASENRNKSQLLQCGKIKHTLWLTGSDRQEDILHPQTVFLISTSTNKNNLCIEIKIREYVIEKHIVLVLH